MPEQEPQPKEKIKAIIVCGDSRAELLGPFLEKNGIEVLGRFATPLCTEMSEFWEKEEKFDVAIIHTDEERGRQFVQDARKVNPNVFILTFSAGKKILRFGDTFIVDTGRNRGEMVERIREGIETKRKTAKPITRSLP